MRTKFFLIVLVAVAITCSVLWFGKKDAQAPMVEQEAPTFVFTSVEAGESINVSFNQADDTATMSGLGYEDVVLTQAVSASGARYVNEELGLELWNKGDEITLSENGDAVFTGTTEPAEEIEDDSVTETTPSDEASVLTEESLSAHAWVWKETSMNNDEVITPKKADAFSLTFSLEGRVNGTTDCNRFSGSYTVTDTGTLSFGPLASTLMFCENSQETEFTKMISDVQSGFIAANGNLILALPFDSGSVVFIPE